ncbi:MAG: hypothetical protein F7C34_05715 [Desulfurococcales archaeon]|nr:hypothetical protein [Desulfurococcales archaeon]
MRRYEVAGAIALFIIAKLVVLWASGATSLEGLRIFATRWDAEHFARLAEEWYSGEADYAFAPLLPATARILVVAGLPSWASVLLVANIGSVALLAGLSRLYDPRTAALVMAFPVLAVYTTAPYSEALALPLFVWGLYAYQRKNYLAAGLLLGASATARYTMALAGAVLVLYTLRRGLREAAALTAGLAPAALLLAAFLASSRWGLTVYFRAERYWQAGLGTPLDHVRWILESSITAQFASLRGIPVSPGLYVARNILFALLAVAGLALHWSRWRRPWETLAAVPGIIVPILATGVPALSMPRLILAGLPAIAGLAPKGRATALIYVAGALAGACVVAVWHMELFFS